MTSNSSFAPHRERALDDLVDRACRRWDAQRQAAAAQRDLPPRTPRAFSIALSREAGTRGTVIAHEVGKLLNWQVYDHELLERIAQEMGLRANLLGSVDERQQSWLGECVAAFLSAPLESERMPLVSESAYVRHLIETVLALGVHGECVIVGRGAAFILPPATTLRVRLMAPVKERVAVLASQLNLPAPEAARRVRVLDRERGDFVQDHFSRNPTDPSLYNLLLDTSRFSVADCAGLIVDALHRLQARKTKESETLLSS